MRRPVILGLLLAAVTLGLFWPLAHFGLVYYDDPPVPDRIPGNSKWTQCP